MTLKIQKGQNNFLSLTDILVNSVYTSRTYRIDFKSNQKRTTQSITLPIVNNNNRFDFEIEEGVDITFDLVGFYTWELYEINGGENLLTSGLAKVSDVRNEPITPTAISTETTYTVADAGQ